MNANDLNKSTEDGKDLNSGNIPENSSNAPVNDEKSDNTADNLNDTKMSEEATAESESLTGQETEQKPDSAETKEEETVNEQPVNEDSQEKNTPDAAEKKGPEEENVADGNIETGNNETNEEDNDKPSGPDKVVHIQLSKDKLIERLKDVLNNYPPNQIKTEVDAIKSAFYKKRNAELEDLKKKFLESGEKEENFTPPADPLESELKKLLQEYKNKRAEYNRRIEEEKERNYQAKLEVIKGIEELINKQESLGETFNEFRHLQQRWREIGIVPQNKVRDLWETYNYTIEKFYNYIKINKELRDLDLKKNLELKTELCKKAEALLLEPTIVKAFKMLQKLHDEWREIGPVPIEKKDELWARFKEATTKINKRHQEYFEGLKEQLKKNLEAKTELCEKAEALASQELNSPKEWEEKSKELVELQQIWKTIGFAPKKDNNLIYERFRAACDNFFNKKREFFKNYKKEQQNNLQKKIELCIQAEAMKDSTDWKHTTEEYIKIQKQWKQIGPVPRKHSDAVWKRFRSACDAFFENKANFFNHIDSEHEKNLELKEKLIEEVKEFTPGENAEDNFRKLQEFQKRWNEIGHVPLADKDRVNQEFRKYINKHFDSLNLDEFSKNIQKFRNKLENLRNSDNFMNKLIQERNKIISKLKQLENDITTWENNIGFIAKSKSSEALVKDFQRKIENGKQNIKLFNKKLDIIESMMD
ncbi:MAG: DUF349 domain-containing protein [Chlorobi bacterium]|nr:DUF349 domain-containing protein [Chlorobiota bacterium]